MGMEQRDTIQLCERNKDSNYVLYQSTPSPIHSVQTSQQLPNNINYEEISDSQESYDYAACLIGSQLSLNTTDNAQDMPSETDSPKRTQAVIQSTSPISIDNMEYGLASRHMRTDDHSEAAAHEILQSSQQSTPPSSQQSI
jgi:hypothetical protein